jgi:superfamily II DNA or RNA helicase
MNREFTEHYEFFNYDWNLINTMTGPTGWKNRQAYRDKICPPEASTALRKQILTNITYHAMGFMRIMQARKKFINEHPKKIEIAKKIIEARIDKKIITFSKKVSVAEQIGYGEVYTGKVSKKRGADILDNFKTQPSGVLNSCEKVNEGLDVPGLSVAIILGLDSAKLKAVQRVGRVIRYEANKQAEIFNIIINNTVETKWFDNAHPDHNYKVIDEQGLDKVLKGEDPGEYVKPAAKFVFRF